MLDYAIVCHRVSISVAIFDNHFLGRCLTPKNYIKRPVPILPS